jgi:hypothetical protein
MRHTACFKIESYILVKNSMMIKIGTSGWNYDHWKGEYYSEQISDEHLLSHYEKTFDTV